MNAAAPANDVGKIGGRRARGFNVQMMPSASL